MEKMNSTNNTQEKSLRLADMTRIDRIECLLDPKSHEDVKVSDEDLELALCEGFMTALQVHNCGNHPVFAADLFGRKVGRITEIMSSAIYYEKTTGSSSKHTRRVINFGTEPLSDSPREQLTDIFISGYVTGQKTATKSFLIFDEDDDALLETISNDIHQWTGKIESTMRASARIIVGRFGINTEKLRGTILDSMKPATSKVLAENAAVAFREAMSDIDSTSD